MTRQIAPLTEREAWKALAAHYESVARYICGNFLPTTPNVASA